ncbi:hypothetical protein BC834DRAFT_421820 [Gloeopeniophorella convolvens]|nr:hypothetical protein BC834DRAFT_421820 [Gloeopeniophorella convolvens]
MLVRDVVGDANGCLQGTVTGAHDILASRVQRKIRSYLRIIPEIIDSAASAGGHVSAGMHGRMVRVALRYLPCRLCEPRGDGRAVAKGKINSLCVRGEGGGDEGTRQHFQAAVRTCVGGGSYFRQSAWRREQGNTRDSQATRAELAHAGQKVWTWRSGYEK